MNQHTEKLYFINDALSLKKRQVLTAFAAWEILNNSLRQIEFLNKLPLSFVINFLVEIDGGIFESFPQKEIKLLHQDFLEGDVTSLKKATKKAAAAFFKEPKFFFNNVNILIQRTRDCWLFPSAYHLNEGHDLTNEICVGFIAHFFYTYFFSSLNYGEFVEDTELLNSEGN